MNLRFITRGRALLLAVLMFLVPTAAVVVYASQGSVCMPTTGTVSGLTFAQNNNAGFAALISSNSGGSAPANDCSGVAVKGQVWLDTSSTPNVMKQFDGAAWIVLGFMDTTNHVWVPPVGGGVNTVASGSTTDLWAVPQASLTISGTTTITAMANASAVPGSMKVVKFAGVLTLTHNATTLVLPGAVNITTAAGDYALVVATSSSNVALASYFKADGTAVINPAEDVGMIKFYGAFGAPAKYVKGYGQALSRAAYPDFTAAVTKTVSAVRVSGSATLTSVSDTSELGANMAVEGTGIPAGTLIASVTPTTIVMKKASDGTAQNASSSGTNNINIFAYGYGTGGDSTTVGVIDCRGRGLVGMDTVAGSAANRITFAGSGIDATALNGDGGVQTRVIPRAELPNVSPAFTGTPQSWNVGNALVDTGFGITVGAATARGGVPQMFSVSVTPAGTIEALGSGVSRPQMGPVAVANCIQRVLK